MWSVCLYMHFPKQTPLILTHCKARPWCATGDWKLSSSVSACHARVALVVQAPARGGHRLL
jgi:hypothetical protein